MLDAVWCLSDCSALLPSSLFLFIPTVCKDVYVYIWSTVVIDTCKVKATLLGLVEVRAHNRWKSDMFLGVLETQKREVSENFPPLCSLSNIQTIDSNFFPQICSQLAALVMLQWRVVQMLLFADFSQSWVTLSVDQSQLLWFGSMHVITFIGRYPVDLKQKYNSKYM